MAKFFKTPFSIGGEHHYVEIKVPMVDASAGNNIICCVDVSGSMSGAPIRNVCEVLRDIYRRTNQDFALFTYNTAADTSKTIKSVERQDLVANGGTNFSSIFNAIRTYMVSNQKSTTWIFMTDGQDQDSATALKQSMQMLKMTMNSLAKAITVTIHVIGFGAVNNDFLEKVRKLGTREGLFRYSAQSAELQNSFNDMFEYAMSSREYTLVINGKSFTASSNDETVSFLIDGMNIDSSTTTEVTLRGPDGESKLPLTPMENIRAIDLIRAINLVAPEDQETVQAIRAYLNTVSPAPGTDLKEKLELEQIKREIDDRMVEYKTLLGEVKMGQVQEGTKLRLSALKHKVTFANVQRKKKLDLRASKNVEYFCKTDITGILDGYKKSLTPEVWNEIKALKSDWVCTYSNDDIYEMMRKSADNIMCVGILIKRNEQAVDSPTKGLELLEVSNTVITYDSFIAALNLAKNAQPTANSYGQFEGVNETFCVVGQMREKINAVIPLYIHPEHMKRIRILEGIWLGYMYTLNSLGYDQHQEIGLLQVLYDMIVARTGTTRNKQFIVEFEKVCQFIINESLGFRAAYGEKTFENYLSSIHGRQTNKYGLAIPLIIGHLKTDLRSVLVPAYYEYLRQSLQKKSADEKMSMIRRLLYGDETQVVKTVASNKDQLGLNLKEEDPDYVEKTFIDYFHDEKNQPTELVSETTSGEDRKLVINEAEVDFIRSILKSIDPQQTFPLPKEIRVMLEYSQLEENSAEKHLDYDELRAELLMILGFDSVVPNNINKSNILAVMDARLQGKFSDLLFLSSF